MENWLFMPGVSIYVGRSRSAGGRVFGNAAVLPYLAAQSRRGRRLTPTAFPL
ncbi:hypothetical protein M8494_20450 [Serratia ureilytica]